MKLKIAYFVPSIQYSGGVSRVTIVKANSLVERGHDVYVIITDSYDHLFQTEPLSDKVHLVDLGIRYYTNENDKADQRKKKRQHKKAIKDIVNRIKPDVLVSVGLHEKFIIAKLKLKYKTQYGGYPIKIREFHRPSFSRHMYGHGIKKKLVWFMDLIDHRILGKKWDAIALLTDEDRLDYWNGTKHNVVTIPNPLTISPIRSNVDSKLVVSVGYLGYPKNYTVLIQAFAYVIKNHSDWKLIIYGDGPERAILVKEIKELGLERNVELPGNTNEIPSKLAKASIYVSTSLSEGFPLSLIEAIASGLPVVAVSNIGVRGVIGGSECGILLDNDVVLLAQTINSLIENENKRKIMSNAAVGYSKIYDINNIIDMWLSLFYDKLKEKNNSFNKSTPDSNL